MTDDIRRNVRSELAKRGMSQNELAERVGVTPEHLSALLTGRLGTLNKSWRGIFETLDMRLIAVPSNARVRIEYDAE